MNLPAWQNHFTFSISTQSASNVRLFFRVVQNVFREMYFIFCQQIMEFQLPVSVHVASLENQFLSHEPVSSIRYKFACAPIKDSDQSAHQRNLIRVFEGRPMGSQGSNDSSGGKLKLWSECADA